MDRLARMPRIARITLINVTAVSQNDLLMLAAVFTMIVISTQVAFVNFLNVRKFEAVPEEELTHQQKAVQTSPVVKALGLDDHHESLADVRQATMRHNAEEVGKQFLLSEREVEVLSLYALGWTQKRVAEELFISPGTAHAHIKRIYAKTGLHSRQEILDYWKSTHPKASNSEGHNPGCVAAPNPGLCPSEAPGT